MAVQGGRLAARRGAASKEAALVKTVGAGRRGRAGGARGGWSAVVRGGVWSRVVMAALQGGRRLAAGRALLPLSCALTAPLAHVTEATGKRCTAAEPAEERGWSVRGPARPRWPQQSGMGCPRPRRILRLQLGAGLAALPRKPVSSGSGLEPFDLLRGRLLQPSHCCS